MPALVALDLPGGPAFVEQLQRIWDAGDAVLPVDQRWPEAMKTELMQRLGVSAVITTAGRHDIDEARPVTPGDAAVIVTSGSTGSPKGVVLTHDAIAASARATSARLEVTEHDHWLACLPLSHVGGLSVVFRALHSGTRLTVHPGFDPEAVQRSGASLVSLVGTALQRIDPAAFRTIVLGGSRPPADRPPNSVTTYGMTETGSGVVYDRRPLDGVELRIVDGEIHLRCDMLLRCYRDANSDSDPKTSDGWFATDDLGDVDDDGLLTVHGRRSELIITGGENVWPDVVEAAIRTMPSVTDVAVVGRADGEWGERVEAVIVPATDTDPPTLDEVRAHVKLGLPAYAAPRHVRFVTQLPRTTLGKLRRADIVDLPR